MPDEGDREGDECRALVGSVGSGVDQIARRVVVADPHLGPAAGRHAAAELRRLRPDDLRVVAAHAASTGVAGMVVVLSFIRPGCDDLSRFGRGAAPEQILAVRGSRIVLKRAAACGERVGPALGHASDVIRPGQRSDADLRSHVVVRRQQPLEFRRHCTLVCRPGASSGRRFDGDAGPARRLRLRTGDGHAEQAENERSTRQHSR